MKTTITVNYEELQAVYDKLRDAALDLDPVKNMKGDELKKNVDDIFGRLNSIGQDLVSILWRKERGK